LQAQAGAGNEEEEGEEQQQQQQQQQEEEEEEGQENQQQQQQQEEEEGQENQQQQQQQQEKEGQQQQQQQYQAAGATQEGQPAHQQAQQVAPCTAQPEAALLLGSLTRTTIRLTGKGLGAGQLERSSTLWRSLWGAMPALRRLELQWPPEMDLLPQLPPMAAFTGLTSLNLRSKNYGIGVDSFQHVHLQVLLELLQECSRLKELKLEVGVGVEGAAAVAGSIPGGSGSQDASSVGVDSSGDSSCCIGWDSLLRCLQLLVPSLQRMLHESNPKDLERAFWG
jgi:flagellar motor protein MotB